jgi:L,D-transpeptidase catalytic domain
MEAEFCAERQTSLQSPRSGQDRQYAREPPLISPEQLAEALDRIHPRDRELLSLSLRRRVPDEALGRLYECSPSEVARRRARAIERLADEMDLQRGEDLGAVLQALLEPTTWSQSTIGEEFAAGGGRSRLAAVPVPEPEPEPQPEPPALAPVPSPAPEAEAEEAEPPEIALAQDAATEAPAAEAPAAEAKPAEDAKPAEAEAAQAEPDPVAQMVAERERQAPDPPRRAVPLALMGLGIAALVGAAGVVGATQFGDKERMVPRSGGGGGDGTQQFVPQKEGPLAAPFPTEPDETSCYTTATVRGPVTLYKDPGGDKRLRIGTKTEWGSQRVLGVVSQRGDWLGVQASELKNHEIAWLQRDQATLDCVQWSIHADLSKRTVTVQHDGKTVRKLRVAIGRSENPTPEGRFSVTDRLQVKGGDPTYGCCVLALTGHQTHLPPYWPGGDRLAIHATNDESSIGNPVSLGCMRAPASQAHWLIDHIPLGTPVFIHA